MLTDAVKDEPDVGPRIPVLAPPSSMAPCVLSMNDPDISSSPAAPYDSQRQPAGSLTRDVK